MKVNKPWYYYSLSIRRQTLVLLINIHEHLLFKINSNSVNKLERGTYMYVVEQDGKYCQSRIQVKNSKWAKLK